MRVRKGSKIAKVWEHLKRCRKTGISRWQAMQDYRLLNLPDAIYVLRERGAKIATTKKRTRCGDEYTVYVLVGE